MKTPSDELFILIKALSSQEKRYFKLFANNNPGDHVYVRLFDVVNSLKEYDEKRVLAILNKKWKIKKLKYLKSYLQEAILKFLEHHHSNYSDEIRLQRYLQRIELLYTKHLFDSAKKIIVKAERVAIENDNYPYVLAILDWKYKMMLSQGGNQDEFDAYQHKGYLNELNHIDIYRNIVEYKMLNVQSSGILKFPENNAVKNKKLNALLQRDLLKEESRALSHSAKKSYCHILGNVYMSVKDWKKCYHYKKKYISLFEEKPLYHLSAINTYIGNIGIAIAALSYMKKNAEVTEFQHKAERFIKTLPKKLQLAGYEGYIVIMGNNIASLNLSFNIDKALEQGEKLKIIIEKYGTAFNSIVFYSNFFSAYFYKENFHKALHCINKVFIFEKRGIWQNIIRATKILNLIVHYELGNETLLPNLCKSTSRYLEKYKELTNTEAVLLEFFSKTILYVSTKQEKANSFSVLKQDLQLALSKSSEREPLLEAFDIISWVESKIENRHFVDIARQKADPSYEG